MTWFEIKNTESIPSPRLVVVPDHVESNLRMMIGMVGGETDRLRPHMKTHKMLEVARRQVAMGITRCKVATLAEAVMAAQAGCTDILFAHQPVGPDQGRLIAFACERKDITVSTIVDDLSVVQQLDHRCGQFGHRMSVWIDVDCGMHRTGVPFGDRLDVVRDAIEDSNHLALGGLHVYDGHIHDPPLCDRQHKTRDVIQRVRGYLGGDLGGIEVVGGGSPTFGIWASETDWQCSPGTPLLWDHGYASAFPDLAFRIAAGLLTRVISKPGDQELCLDLGHKAVASEMPLSDRVLFPAIPDAVFQSHSEEHLVLKTTRADQFSVGDTLLGFPKHICPTAALHKRAYLIEKDGQYNNQTWQVDARDRLE